MNIIKSLSTIVLLSSLMSCTALLDMINRLPKEDNRPNKIKVGEVQNEFVEVFGGGEGIRFKVKNLNISNEGNQAVLSQGGKVEMSLDINHQCDECGSAINQIIIGLADEKEAQACIWDGFQSSDGWQKVSFSLNVPDTKGVYFVRVRYAQAFGCDTALGWWRVDRPEGPDHNSTIGKIEIK